jgi:hypothetical protein
VYHENKIASGSKEFNAPFPVSPSGGKPGRAGSPHAGSTLRASKSGWHVSMLPAPPQEGCRPLVHPPRVHRVYFQKLCGKGNNQAFDFSGPMEMPEQKEFKDGRHVGIDFYDLLIEPILRINRPYR